jgi:hypothetical protein
MIHFNRPESTTEQSLKRPQLIEPRRQACPRPALLTSVDLHWTRNERGHDIIEGLALCLASSTLPNSKPSVLALIDEVGETGNPIVIARNGKPLVELSPLGIWKNKVIIKGDIISPNRRRVRCA